MKTANEENVTLAEKEELNSSETVSAQLKWFNAPKGFGFVIPDGEDVDAFLHVTTLQRAGIQTIGEGARIKCDIQRGDKGALVTCVHELLTPGLTPDISVSFKEEQKPAQSYPMTGVVKWYKEDKGFGFVVPDDGMKDIFIHKTCLERHGIETIEAGQRVSMTVKNVAKGREVIDFEVVAQ